MARRPGKKEIEPGTELWLRVHVTQCLDLDGGPAYTIHIPGYDYPVTLREQWLEDAKLATD